MRPIRLTLLLSLLTLPAVARSAAAQHDSHAHHAGGGWVPREVLERPVPIRQGIGVLNDPVTTTSTSAQAFYNQGLAYLHSYVWIEAARSFNQALRDDPSLALAYLGLSYAYSGLEDDQNARATFAKARSLASRASEREQRRIDIRAKQLEAFAEPASLSKLVEFRKAIDSALAAWPDDAELWLLRGNAEESQPFGRGQRGGAATIAFYEAALGRVKDHFAAHHYLTHTYETIGLADRALKHGEIYARLVPTVPHAQHMYGHDLRRVGRIEEAIVQFEKTKQLEEAYFASENISPEMDWHYAHNLSLLATAYQYQGRMRECETLLRKMWALPKYTAYFGLWGKEWPEFLIGRGRATEALAAADEMTRSKWAAVRSVGHALAGSALLELKRQADAGARLEEAKKEVAQISGTGPLAVTTDMVRPYVEALRGELLLRDGKHEEGAVVFQDVQRRVRTAHGADAWIQALFRLESMARIARDVGNWKLAESTAKQMLDHDASYAGTRYALALVAAHNAEKEVARREFTAALKLWSSADADLAEPRQAREALKDR